MSIEQHYCFKNALEIRALNDGGSRIVGGYAVVFDQLSENLGGFRERIARTALDGVDTSSTVALYNHDSSRVLGSAASGTLSLRQDDTGLSFSVDMPDTTFADDLYKSLKRGDIAGSSFGFQIAADGEEWDFESDVPIRTVTRISSLPEISVGVVFPAYPQASSVVERCRRAAAENARCLRDIERQRRIPLIQKINGHF